jgi:hypothetical protein
MGAVPSGSFRGVVFWSLLPGIYISWRRLTNLILKKCIYQTITLIFPERFLPIVVGWRKLWMNPEENYAFVADERVALKGSAK